MNFGRHIDGHHVFEHFSLPSAANLVSYDVLAGTLCLLQSLQTTNHVQLVWFVQLLIIFKIFSITVQLLSIYD